MDKLNIDIIKKLIKTGKIRWTNHVMIRLLQRNISQDNIKKAILTGEIIEEYKDSYPYPSCLIYGITVENKVLHVVCGFDGNELWIVTAYYPDNKEWEKDLRTRKEFD